MQKKFTSIQEVKSAVMAGKSVFWSSSSYRVEERRGEFYIDHSGGSIVGMSDSYGSPEQLEKFYCEVPNCYETFLPVFPGFGDTAFDPADQFLEQELSDEDQFREHYPELDGVSWDEVHDQFPGCIDWTPGYEAASQAIARGVEVLLDGIVTKIEYQGLVRPPEYNFFNDVVNCAITINPVALVGYLGQHWEDFEIWIDGRYSSCSGFVSGFSSYASDWRDRYTAGFTDFSNDPHHLGAVLQFIAEHQQGGREHALEALERECEVDLEESFQGDLGIDTELIVPVGRCACGGLANAESGHCDRCEEWRAKDEHQLNEGAAGGKL